MRLIDITVNEVSLVDKAANKRKFAFMKRETVDVKALERQEEVETANKIIKAEAEVKPVVETPKAKYTPEQIAEATALNAELIELVAQLKTQSK